MCEKGRFTFWQSRKQIAKGACKKWNPFFAKMNHNANCYDISNIMMTVMMVAGNSYVENNFARAIVHCLTLVRILLGLDGLMHFFKFVAHFSFCVDT